MSESLVRFQRPTPNRRGAYPGVFTLMLKLGIAGKLSPSEERFWRENSAWYEANFTDPSVVDPSIYDRKLNPLAASWFKPSAGRLIERVPGYLEILSAHGVACVRVESADPGRVIYEDADQVVAVPRDWVSR